MVEEEGGGITEEQVTTGQARSRVEIELDGVVGRRRQRTGSEERSVGEVLCVWI